MICTLLNRDPGFLCRRLLSFLDRSISTAMGCFFVCFRSKDDHASRRPHAIRSAKPSDVVISRNRLSSLFLAEEREDARQREGESYLSGSPQMHKQLRDEAKFLKACGTLSETPGEIKKTSARFRGSPSKESYSTPEFRSWLPNTSTKIVGMDRQPERMHTPTKLSEMMANDVFSPGQTPNSCITNTQDTGSTAVNSRECSGAESADAASNIHTRQMEYATTPITPWPSAPGTQYRNKSVQFDCGTDADSLIGSSSGHENEDFKRYGVLDNQSVTNRSLYPTPLKLADDMQTPGTVFPGNIGNLPNGMTRVRSEYVYSVSDDDHNVSQRKLPREDHPTNDQLSSEPKEFPEQTKDDELKLGRGFKKASDGKEVKVEVGLSEWLKPPMPRQEARFGRAQGDRPIIGLVATHWNENEVVEISPKKGWDGNGIPNSTNKYKEDQKVSWHATPFEERLEKALSEESFSQRNHTKGMPVVFDDGEDDTAASKLQRSAHTESLVSY